MIRVYGALLAIVLYGAHVTLGPHLQVLQVSPNLLLLGVILLGVQWVHPGFFVLAALLGLAQDSLSHGLLGVYGIGFLATGVMANVVGRLIYDRNLLVSVGIVFGLTLAHGMFALILLGLAGSDTAWGSWFFGRVVPQGVYHALLTPLALMVLKRLQRWIPPYPATT